MKNCKPLRILIAAAVFSSMLALPCAVSAATVNDRAEQITETANAKIESDVLKVQDLYATLSANGLSDSSTAIQRQIENLQKETGKTAQQAEKELDKLGVSYQCTYETVTLGSNTVIIDPFLCIA